MPKKSLIFITLLLGVTVIFIYFAVKGQKLSNLSGNQPTPTKIVPKTALLSFDPAVVTLTSGTQQLTSNIIVNTDNKPITGVQVELHYDPAVISNVSIVTPGNSLMGSSSDYIVLFKTIDQKNGRVSYALGVSPQATAKQGTGVIATLSFTATKNTSAKSSLISFTEKSMVTSIDATTSVLKDTTPLIISF